MIFLNVHVVRSMTIKETTRAVVYNNKESLRAQCRWYDGKSLKMKFVMELRF